MFRGDTVKNKIIIRIILSLLITIICYGVIALVYKKLNSSYNDLVAFEGNGYLVDSDSNLEDSGITGEEYTIDTTYNAYYNILSVDEKLLYKQIYANILSLKTTFKTVTDVDSSRIKYIIEAVTNDHPELFWIDNNFSYKYTSDNICRQITLSFNDLADNYEENKKQFEEKVNSIISAAQQLDSDYDKELFVHNTLINNITYDLNASYNQTAYSALVNESTVCAGYSKAFQYIMNKLGIVTYYVVGTSQGENHSWNIVKLDDGYYNIDLTWDSTGNNHYAFFNLTDKQFSKTHTRGELSSSLPSCEETTYAYKKTNNSTKDENSTNNANKSNNDNNVSNYNSSNTNSKNTTNTNSSSSNVNNSSKISSDDNINEETIEETKEEIIDEEDTNESQEEIEKEKEENQRPIYRWNPKKRNQ